jgi:hypothetical protein
MSNCKHDWYDDANLSCEGCGISYNQFQAEENEALRQQVDNMEEAQAATLSLLIEAHGWLQSVPDPYVSSVMKRINEHIKGEKGNE